METKKAFKNHKVNGFFLTFPNGNAISTIWSSGSYTENHDWEILKPDGKIDFENLYNTPLSSNDVEVMVDCQPVVLELIEAKFGTESAGGSVFGHLNITQWLEIINILATH